MKTAIGITLLVAMAALPCLSGTAPSVSARVEVVGEFKEYSYTMLNDLDSGASISMLIVHMPEAGARAVISTAISRAGWFDLGSFRPLWSWWGIWATADALLPPGEEITFKLTTPAGTPTAYDYRYVRSDGGNWWWEAGGLSQERGFGPSTLPVPAPEPSSLSALALAAAGLGGVLLRRRRM